MIPQHFNREPKYLWNYFFQMTQLPRPSKHEELVQNFIIKEAQKHGCDYKIDSVGNIVVYVKGSAGHENKEPIIIQNHMDMVTDHRPHKKINFKTDPIETFEEDGWIKAKDTTLGADNGIGCSAALALMADPDISHPPLELLFTVDEETGLKGAWGVEPSFFKSKRMLNLDTEEWGSFYIGCAGGIDYEITHRFTPALIPQTWETFKVTCSGFLGGHSGIDIHRQRGNAIKLMTDFLQSLDSKNFSLHEIKAGKAHNIIPRDLTFSFSCSPEQAQKISEIKREIFKSWKSFLPKDDQQFNLEITSLTHETHGILGSDVDQLLSFLQVFPHGAHKYDLASRDLVSLSNNLALCFLVKGEFYVLTSLRFFDREEAKSLEQQLKSLCFLAGFECKKESEYPSWKPIRENKLLNQMTSLYQELLNEKPHITAIHAGLECGILRDKIGPIDAVSFGPTITGAHSPDEKVEIASVEKFWTFLKNVMAHL